jgi:hypothetical protein
VGTLKAQNGHLLARSGHLCLTCCDPCTGPTCINFATLFPRVLSFSPDLLHEPVSWSCLDLPFYHPEFSYRTNVINPLGVAAELVISTTSLFDDDLYVDGESQSGIECGINWQPPIGTVLGSPVAPGSSVELSILDNIKAYTGAYGCACWRPATLSMSYAAITLAKTRYELCKACSDTLQESFSCRLVGGCCFGRKRSDPDFHCPKGVW